MANDDDNTVHPIACVELDTNDGVFAILANVTYEAVAALPVKFPITLFIFAVPTFNVPLIPTPPLTINAPDEVVLDTVVLVMVIAFVVVDPRSVTSCKSSNVGAGSYVGSLCNTHCAVDALR